ncbi:MAG: hypothetical protein WAL55_10610 [Candidatus Acidiferrales bacterium]
MTSTRGQGLNTATIISIAIPAFALQSVAHEICGHGVTAWLTGAKVTLITSTALQTQGGSRLVPTSGPLANLFFGALAYIVLRRIPRFGAARFFLWIFAFAHLFIGTGYILYSGVINFGDSAYVIAGLQPAWLYRFALILFGAWGYRFSVGLAVRDTLGLIHNGSLLREDVLRLVYPSCLAGALLYIIASVFNPVSPSLILYDGVSMAAGIAFGFLLIPRVVERLSSKAAPAVASAGQSNPTAIPFSAAWTVFGAISAVLFIIFLGHGIRVH